MGRSWPTPSRWTLVAVGAAAMGVAGTYQFVWSSIRVPLGARLAVPEAALGTVFTLFIVFQTLSQFPAGWVRDRYGPRIPGAVGAVLLALGYALVATAGDLAAAFLGYGIGGVGVGITYTVALNTAVKWFDDRRGLATGIVGMAYGGGSFLIIPLVRGNVGTDFEATVLGLGLIAGAVVLGAAVVFRDPDRPDAPGDGPERSGDDPGGDSPRPGDGDRPAPDDDPGRTPDDDPGGAPNGDPGAETDDDPSGEPNDDPGNGTAESEPPGAEPDGAPGNGGERAPVTWRGVIRTWQFWLLYAAFVAVNGVGLMVIGKVVAYAGELDLSVAAATAAASVVAVADAGGVAVVGAVSDRLGRERTAAASLVLSGVALAGVVLVGDAGVGVAFVALVGVAGFFRSPVFSVFPSIVGDYFGAAHSSENYAVLYTAKLWGGVMGGTVASGLVIRIGWSPSFLLGAGLMTAAGLSLVALRPPRDP